MKLTDMIITAIIKRGAVIELRNVRTDVGIPMNRFDVVTNGILTVNQAASNIEMLPEKFITVNLSAELLTIKIDKEKE